MARYTGYVGATEQFELSESFVHQTPRARPSGPAQKDMSDVEPASAPTGLIPRTTGNWLFTSTRRVGYIPFSPGRDLLFERVWVEPRLIDAGFITEEVTYDISVWNAYQARSAEFTLLSGSATEGTSLPTPTLPYAITPSADLTLTLTISEDGPPVQSTTYTLVVDTISFDVEVVGVRVVDLVPNPNWAGGLAFTYKFETAMFSSQRFVEQRRPLLDSPYRAAKAEYVVSDTEAHRFFWVLAYGHDKIFGLPVYNEKLLCTDIPNGGTTITTSTATASMYNLNNLSTHIAIVDHSAGTSEIKEVDSIGANSVVVTQSIAGTFDVNTTAVYPVVFVTVTALSKGHASDDVETVGVEFSEFNNG